MALQTPVDRIATLPGPGPRRPQHGLPRKPARLLRLSSDTRLVELVRGGSEPAFEVLFDRHSRGILAFCRHMLGSPDEAEDAVQHTFLNVYSDLLASDRPIQLRPWLYTIARNRCVSMLRARRERPADNLEELPTENLSTAVQRRQDLRDLLRDVVELPEHQRAALMLAEIGGASHDEIAQVLGVERARVKGLVFQARCSLLASREARDTPCEEIRDQLMELRGGSLLRTPLRRHLRSCPRCREFRVAVREQRRLLALALPVVPSLALKAAVMGGGATSGGAVAAGAGTTAAAGVGTTATAGLGTTAAAKVLVVAVLAGGGAAGVEVATHQPNGDRDRARAERRADERTRAGEPPPAAAALPGAAATQPAQSGWVELPAAGDRSAAPASAGPGQRPASFDARGHGPRDSSSGAPAAGAQSPGSTGAPVQAPGLDPAQRPAHGDQPPGTTRPPSLTPAQVPGGSNRGTGSSGGGSDSSGRGSGGSDVDTKPKDDHPSGGGKGSKHDRDSNGDSNSGRGRSDDADGNSGRGRSDDDDRGSGRGRSDDDDRGSGHGRGSGSSGSGSSGSGSSGSGSSGSGSSGSGSSGSGSSGSGSSGSGSGRENSGRGSGGGRGSRDDEGPSPESLPAPPVTVPTVPEVSPVPTPDSSGKSGKSGKSGQGRSEPATAPAITPVPSVAPSQAP